MDRYVIPSWLEALLCEKFFGPCLKHQALKKNERNIHCIHCCQGICHHCLQSHNSHHLLQIRRYVYQDVIRLLDIQELLDCSQVQAYIINGAKVVFLNERPQQRPLKMLGNMCESCGRSLQDAYHFCSVACKVDATMKKAKNLHAILLSSHLMDEMKSHQQLSPQSVLLPTDSSGDSTASEERLATINDVNNNNSNNSNSHDHDHGLTATFSSSPSCLVLRLHVNGGVAVSKPAKRKTMTPCRAPFF